MLIDKQENLNVSSSGEWKPVQQSESVKILILNELKPERGSFEKTFFFLQYLDSHVSNIQVTC